MTRAVGASIEIDAPVDKVWAVLRDTPSYPEWNPFTISVNTDFSPDSPVDMQVCLRGKKPMRQIEYISGYEEGRRFSWGVDVGPGWFIHANRWQELTDLGEGRTRYETLDEFTGIGVPLMLLLMEKHMARGFAEVAHALKARCES